MDLYNSSVASVGSSYFILANYSYVCVTEPSWQHLLYLAVRLIFSQSVLYPVVARCSGSADYSIFFAWHLKLFVAFVFPVLHQIRQCTCIKSANWPKESCFRCYFGSSTFNPNFLTGLSLFIISMFLILTYP